MTEAPDLLPCPFCAVYPSYEVAAFSTRHRISCEDCEFEMQKPTREEAQRAWNTRDHPMTVAEAAKVIITEIYRPATNEERPDWRYLSRLDLPSLRALSQGGE